MIDGAEDKGPVAQQRAILQPILQRARAAASAGASSFMHRVGRMPLDRKALLALAAMAFFACYLRFLEFGLYEDDLNQTRFWTYTAGEMGRYIERLFTSGAGGRPIGLTFLRGGFWAGYNLGGLPTLYAMGFAVFVANAFLTFKITKAIAPVSIALLAGFAFVLYPADALKFTVVRGLAVQPSLTFGLGAMLFYAHRRYIAAYLFAALSVGIYEFGILPFFLAPFFILETWREKLIRVVGHGAITAGIMGAIILVRLKYATGHLSDLTPLSHSALARRFYVALTSGPLTSAKGFFTKPAAFFRDFEPWHIIVVVAVTAVSFICLSRLWRDEELTAANTPAIGRSLSQRANDFFGTGNPNLAVLVGVAAWIVAYSMAVSASRFPPTTEFGRITSVHTAATFGASLTFAGLVWMAAIWMKRANFSPKKILIPIISLYLAALGGFQAVVQSACIKSWALQKHLWRQIVDQVPDWQNGTVVVVDYKKAPNSRYVYTMSWATAVIADNMYKFPKEWKDPPTVVFRPQLSSTADVVDGQFILRRRPWFDRTPVDPDKIIYFSVGAGDVLKRENRKFHFKNYAVQLSSPGPRSDFEKKPLYKVLIED